jgi:sigma-B regulation protein RsbU (phosphoserine phosphatase)
MVIDRLAVSCRYESCVELGGDLCDYVSIGPGRIAVLVADVMGHGVSAAMLTGVVKSAFRAASPDGYQPRAMVQRLWSNMDAFGSERFVTLIAAVVSVDERRVDYVNAGHPAALLCSGDRRVSRLASTGPLVSPALRDCAWEQRSVPFDRGDLLFLYTDGVSDAIAEGDEEAIVQLIQRHPTADATLLDAVMERVREESGGRPPPDDLTLLSVYAST